MDGRGVHRPPWGAEVGSNELHLLRYIYLSTFFGFG